MKKKKAPTTRRGHKDTTNDTSTQAQRQRLLMALIEAGADGITTIQARHELNILAPAPRVHELRHSHGRNIKTIPTIETTPEGYEHKVARYVLMPGAFKGVAR